MLCLASDVDDGFSFFGNKINFFVVKFIISFMASMS